VLDSPLQPNRLEVFGATAVAALGAGDAAAGIAVTFGSVEAAADAQNAELARVAQRAGAVHMKDAPTLWPVYATLWRRPPSATLLTVGSLPGRLRETFAAVTRAATGARMTVGGCAVVGSFRVLVSDAPASSVATLIEALRAALAPWGGTVMVHGAPRAVRTAIDPWGPVPPDALGVMRTIKATFDPERRLNPGRFVGGL
jgi:glycolate oxidase FAD binding subunit